jgi:hypothetical protein
LVLGLALAASASARSAAPYRTEAWADSMLGRVHYWRGHKVRPSLIGCFGSYIENPTRNARVGYKSFGCHLWSISAGGQPVRSFEVTVHALAKRPYFRVTPGWPHV